MRSILLFIFVALSCIGFSQPDIKAGEYFIGSIDPGNGNGTQFSVQDGAWNEAVEAIIANAQLITSSNSPVIINLRIKDDSNNWGPLFKKTLFISTVNSNVNNVSVTYGEFFLGNFDPGAGQGTPILAFDGAFDEAIESVLSSNQLLSSAAPTILFNVRLKDNANNWGPLFKKNLFFNVVTNQTTSVDVQSGEFFLGNFDPGAGQGTPILAFDGAFDEAIESVLSSNQLLTSVVPSILFNVRIKDNSNNWGPLFKKNLFFNVVTNQTTSVDVQNGEFFLGNFDPGAGQGTPILAFDGAYDEAIETVLSSNQILNSATPSILFNVRLKDNLNNWGPLFKKNLFFNVATAQTRSVDVSYAEFFFGFFDPGEGQGTPIVAFDGSYDDALESFLRTNATWNISTSPTLFNIRIKDALGNWGPLFKKTVFPNGANPTPNLITQGSSMSVCPNSNVTLSYDGPNGFSPVWFNGATSNSISFTISNVGYYSVSATFGNTTYFDSIYIDYLPYPNPTISPSGSILVCASSAINLSTPLTSNTNYQWFFNGSQIVGAVNASYMPTQVGSYSLVATTTTSGCSITSNTTTLYTSGVISPSGNVTSCTTPTVLTAPTGTGNAYQWKLNGVNIPGATQSTLNATTSGSYSVLVTNGTCSNTTSLTVLTITSGATIPTISANGPTSFCSGGSVVLTSSAPSGNVWSNGATTQSITVSQAGTYSVTVTTGSCVATSAPTTVTMTTTGIAPTINSSGPTTFCSGGSVVLTSSSATGNIWSNGATTQSITVNQSGTFTVTSGTGSCSATSVPTIVTVNPTPAAPTISANGPTTFCSGGTVLLTSSATTGNAWSNGATTQSITVNQSGSYTVTSSSGSCIATSTPTVVTVNLLPATPTISANGPTTFCSGGTVVLTSSATTGNAWSNGATTQSITVNQSGSYTVTSSSGSCSATSTPTVVTVNLLPATPTISANGPTTFCSGGTVVLTSSATTGNAWSNGATTQSITVNQSGSYTVTSSSGSCSATSTPTVVTVNPLPATPTISANGPTTFCSGGTVVLTSSATTGNAWSNGATTQSITVNQSGSYTVTSSSGSCSATSTPTVVTVNLLPATPTISANGPTTFCSGGTVVLTSSATTGNAWSNGATTQSITVNQSGTYTVTSSSGSCSATSTPTVVTVNPLPAAPTISANGPTTFCSGGTVVLTSSATTGNVWSNGATTQSITVNQSGSYTVTASSGSCIVTSTPIVVIVNSLPIVTCSTNQTICSGSSVTLNGFGASTYNWNNSVTNNTPFNPTNTQTYTVTGTDVNGCTGTACVTITVNPTPNVVITSSNTLPLCPGGNTQFSTPLLSGATYQWFLGTNPIVNATNNNYTASIQGAYSVKVTTQLGCQGSSNPLNLSFIQVNLTAQGPLTFCQGGSVQLQATIGAGNTYKLIKNGQIPLNSTTSSTFNVTTSGIYEVQVTTPSGCVLTTNSIVVQVLPNPTASILSSGPLTFCSGPSLSLQANTNGTNVSYQWRKNGVNITGANSSTYSVTQTGAYSVVIANQICPSTSATTSNVLNITVNPTPIPNITASGLSISPSTNVTLSTTSVAGSTYLWHKMTGSTAYPISGATQNTYTTNVSGAYRVKVTNSFGCSAFSSTKVISAVLFPVIGVTCIEGGIILSKSNVAPNSALWYEVIEDSLVSVRQQSTSLGCKLLDKYEGTFQLVDNTEGERIIYNEVKINCISDLLIYPNPTMDDFYIDNLESLDEIISIQLYDGYGKLLKKYQNDERHFNVNGLASGIYYIRIESKGQTSSLKLSIR